MLNGEIPNYIIKFICVRRMLRFFFSQLLITSNYSFSVRIYSCSFVLMMSLLWPRSSATLRGMIVNLFSFGQFMIFFYYFIISLLGSECKNRKRPVNLFLIQMIFFFSCSIATILDLCFTDISAVEFSISVFFTRFSFHFFYNPLMSTH